MLTLSNFISKCFFNINKPLVKPSTNFIDTCRYASKKAGGCTSNAGNSKPKHRGWKRQDGSVVTKGTILVTQNSTRFHPGLNVGIGKNGTLYAIYPGKVVVTCEKAKPNWSHKWVRKNYRDRIGQTFYKKYFNVITEPEHKRFTLIDSI